MQRDTIQISMVCNPKICIETQFKFLWFWPSKTSLWDSMMLILVTREILYTGPLGIGTPYVQSHMKSVRKMLGCAANQTYTVIGPC